MKNRNHLSGLGLPVRTFRIKVLIYLSIIYCSLLVNQRQLNAFSLKTFSNHFQTNQPVKMNTPLIPYFVENKGQIDPVVKYYVAIGQKAFWFTDEGIIFNLTRKDLINDPQLLFDNQNPNENFKKKSNLIKPESLVLNQEFLERKNKIIPIGQGSLNYYHNYYCGSTPSTWLLNVPTYKSVQYKNVWDSIDIKYVQSFSNLEQVIIVKPGADPSDIKIGFKGTREIKIMNNGCLLVMTDFGNFVQTQPQIYQETCHGKERISGRYKLIHRNAYTFEVGPYNTSSPIIIDPVLVLSTLIGGSNDERGEGISVDNSGNMYIIGRTNSPDFPTSTTSQIIPSASIFISKLSQDGSLVFSTFIPCTGFDDISNGIIIDASGDAYVTGITSSRAFPVSSNAFQKTHGGGLYDAFILKMKPSGFIAASSYFGGNGDDKAFDIDIDQNGNLYLVGTTNSSDLPIVNPIQSENRGQIDIFITRFNPNLSTIPFSTYLGGQDKDIGNAIAVDLLGYAYITGETRSGNFPILNAFQNTLNNASISSAFVTKVNTETSTIKYSTFLGGSKIDVGEGIAVDHLGSAYIVGYTQSNDFPIISPLQASKISTQDAFLTKLNPDGSSLEYSTFIGGSGSESATDVSIDHQNRAYVVGWTWSNDFPTVNEFQNNRSGYTDAFLFQTNKKGAKLLFSTFFGGSSYERASSVEVGRTGYIYMTGYTLSEDFPVINSNQPLVSEKSDEVFIVKIKMKEGEEEVEDEGITVNGIEPESGGDVGTVSVAVFGTDFKQGCSVKLTKNQKEIEGAQFTISQDGRTIYTAFNLSNQEKGLWDLVITNPNREIATLQKGFTIIDGRKPSIWIDILGNSIVRINQETSYNIIIGNNGNVDAYGVPFWIGGIPKNTKWKLNFKITPPPNSNISPPTDYSVVPLNVETENEILIPLYLGIIPAESSICISISLELQELQEFNLHAWTCKPYFQSPMDPDAVACGIEVIEFAASEVISAAFPAGDCIGELREFIVNSHLEMVSLASQGVVQGGISEANGVFSMTQVFFSGVQFALSCGAYAYPPAAVAATTVKWVNLALNVADAISTCNNFAQKLWESNLNISGVGSVDPNEKIGSLGVGSLHFVPNQQPLRYLIMFENLRTATAPAQEVSIKDQLDPAIVDLNTLKLGPISFGDKQVFPPYGTNQFTSEVDLRPSKNLIVQIHTILDTISGLLTWQLKSIDPATGTLPLDPFVGFLPPNLNHREGEGSVFFTVKLHHNAADGLLINNLASIKFDQNPVIRTNVWTNTVDASPPSSKVTSKKSRQKSTTIKLGWSGSDIGSGIHDYTVFVSIGDAPFKVWLRNTSNITAMFISEKGKKYSFYCIARDNAGNVENKKNQIDTKISIYGDCIIPVWIIFSIVLLILAIILYLIIHKLKN